MNNQRRSKWKHSHSTTIALKKNSPPSLNIPGNHDIRYRCPSSLADQVSRRYTNRELHAIVQANTMVLQNCQTSLSKGLFPFEAPLC